MICKGFGICRLIFWQTKRNATMPNIHGLHSNARDSSDSEGEAENRYVGGIGAQGGGRCVSWYLLPESLHSSLVLLCACAGWHAIGGMTWIP